jgi:quercetin dioxygenase-like cupin family protein
LIACLAARRRTRSGLGALAMAASQSTVHSRGDMRENGVVYTPTNAATMSSPEPGMRRQVLAYNHNVMLVRHHFLKGWTGTSHSHPHEQLVYVVTGRIQFDADGKTIELRSGDSVIVEGNVEHRATALEDSEVLDVFAPFREDYVP